MKKIMKITIKISMIALMAMSVAQAEAKLSIVFTPLK